MNKKEKAAAHAKAMREWRVKNKTRYDAWRKRYQKKNRKHLTEIHNRWARENKEHVRRRRSAFYRKHLVRLRAGRRAANDKMKSRAIKAMGGKCSKCGYADERALQFHHRNGDGARHRGRRGVRCGWWLHVQIVKRASARKRLELLCANCHMIADYELRQEKRKQPCSQPAINSHQKKFSRKS